MEQKKNGAKVKVIIVVLILLFGLFMTLINFITDFLWFRELGYISVFFTKLFTQLKIGIPVFVVVLLLSYMYLMMLKRGYYKKVASNDTPNEKIFRLTGIGYSAVFSAIVTYLSTKNLWFKALEFFNSTKFDIDDPLFGHDISFYIFKLDFIKTLNDILMLVIVAFAALTVVYYMTLISLRKPQIFEKVEDDGPQYGTDVDSEEYDEEERFGGNVSSFEDAFKKFGKNIGKKAGSRRKTKQFDDGNFKHLLNIASKQLTVLGIIFFLMVGVSFFLRQYDLLYSSTGVLYGAGYTDVNVTLWMYRIIMGLAVVAAFTLVIGVSKRSVLVSLTVPVLMIAVGLVGTGAAALVQNYVVSPDEINKESKYLERNIEYTQYAYGLDEVDTRNFASVSSLTATDIENNPETINNIRINDYEPTKKFYNQTQSIRQYYTFNGVDVDRYMIDGEYTQVFLSAREIDESKISEEWLNRHLKYTHGYGITLSRVDKITASGQPDMLIQNIPPESDIPEIQITRPEIYFGELTDNYVLVNTNEQEFDYPDGAGNKYNQYDGTAGIKLNLLNRFMFTVREQQLKILVSTNITSDSKIIINRDVTKRVSTIMPYLSYEKDPYMVTVDGKLYWIIDAYTTSSNYPYSEPYASDTSINYVRNSVKVVIDAYNGTTDYYIVDETDPIAMTMQKIYPALFKSIDQMPEGLRAHLRYPNALFSIQASVYQRYHMEDVAVFYQNEDKWAIANEIYGITKQQMSPNYYIMKLPGESQAEFVNTIPYTPMDKQNMMSLLVARNDGEHYGELVLYQLPKNKIIYGPEQIEAQIDQNTEISKEFSLWNSSGSTYTRGNMFVIPIENSLIYVEPVYLEATNSSIPEVKRVIVAYNDRIAYEETLEEALISLFGASDGSNQGTPSGTDIETPEDGGYSQAQLIEKANEAYAKAVQAQQNGNWAAYGTYLDQLQSYLTQLAEGVSTEEAAAEPEATAEPAA